MFSRPNLALLLIDSISAFYWQDRCEGGANISKQEERLSDCADLLARLLRWVIHQQGRFVGSPRGSLQRTFALSVERLFTVASVLFSLASLLGGGVVLVLSVKVLLSCVVLTKALLVTSQIFFVSERFNGA